MHRRTTTSKPKTTITLGLSRATKLPMRRKAKPTATTTGSSSESQVTRSTPKPSAGRFRFPQRKKPVLVQTTTVSSDDYEDDDTYDQTIESSNQQSLEENVGQSIETTELSDIAIALQEIQQAPLRPHGQSKYTYRPIYNKSPTLRQKKPQPQQQTTKQLFTQSRQKISSTSRQPYQKLIQPSELNRSPSTDYDYYDDRPSKLVSQIPEHSKVLIHSSGLIECLDQGNFPHPVSCKKFISCNKMYNDKVVGFEYTCPSYLSFDPVGGMCNWAAGIGCEQQI